VYARHTYDRPTTDQRGLALAVLPGEQATVTRIDPQTRSERINLRVDPEVDALLREAAALEHKSLSAFLLDAARERAQRTVDTYRRIEVSAEEFDRLEAELERPAQVVEPLLRLAERVAERRAATP
jgi:uncharacterized protein (DUF1778 family)